MDIAGIRRLPGVKSKVDGLIASVQKDAPSLDRRPNFTLGKPLGPPHSKKVTVHESDDDDEPPLEQGFVYHTRPDGTLRRVKVV